MKSFLAPFMLSLSVCYTTTCLADDIQLTGIQSQTVTLPAKNNPLAMRAQSTKTIPLLTFKLSHTAQMNLSQRQESVGLRSAYEPGALQHSKQLGMNDEPVLDQGAHGTCTTFAATAAVEATIHRPNTISQLCQLQLGNYLATTGYYPSGWDGMFGHMALHQIEAFGIVTKTQQAEHGCGGLSEYPALDDTLPTGRITPETFHQMSAELPFLWFPILHVNESFSKPINPIRILNNIKASLNHNDRVLFGTLLVDVSAGTVGALGTHHVKQDTWVVTPRIRQDIETGTDFAGHEMIITGYDDDAIATDDTGKQYRGLLTLRNSWGPLVGDQGNFYMSYEYFMNLVVEAYSIHMPASEA